MERMRLGAGFVTDCMRGSWYRCWVPGTRYSVLCTRGTEVLGTRDCQLSAISYQPEV